MSDEIEEVEEDEYIWEEIPPPTDVDIIYAMHNAISAVDYVDGRLMGVDEEKRNVQRKSVIILSRLIDKMFDEIVGFCEPDE